MIGNIFTPRSVAESSIYQTPRGRNVSRSNSGLSLASLASFTTDSLREFQDETALAKFIRLDFYGGPRAEFRKGTLHGALMSLIAVIFGIILILREFQYNLSIRINSTLQVDTKFDPTGKRTNFTFSIQFPNIACNDISIGADDSNGNPQMNLEHYVMFLRLDGLGRVIGNSEKQNIGNTVKDELSLLGQTGLQAALVQYENGQPSFKTSAASGELCGDCFGAGEPSECCNSCDEVRDKYRRLGWTFDTSIIPQCNGSFPQGEDKLSQRAMRKQAISQEGCYMNGYLQLSKMRGNVHFAPRSTPQPKAEEAGDYLKHIYQSFNTSHSIGVLRFGETVPGITYPLEGIDRRIIDSYGMYSYYVRIVPTTYVPLYGATVTTNQYSVTEHLKHVEPGSNRGLPGVYFHYEMSTITSRIEEFRYGYLQFFTSLLAVVGGLYTVLGIVDHAIGTIHLKNM